MTYTIIIISLVVCTLAFVLGAVTYNNQSRKLKLWGILFEGAQGLGKIMFTSASPAFLIFSIALSLSKATISHEKLAAINAEIPLLALIIMQLLVCFAGYIIFPYTIMAAKDFGQQRNDFFEEESILKMQNKTNDPEVEKRKQKIKRLRLKKEAIAIGIILTICFLLIKAVYNNETILPSMAFGISTVISCIFLYIAYLATCWIYKGALVSEVIACIMLGMLVFTVYGLDIYWDYHNNYEYYMIFKYPLLEVDYTTAVQNGSMSALAASLKLKEFTDQCYQAFLANMSVTIFMILLDLVAGVISSINGEFQSIITLSAMKITNAVNKEMAEIDVLTDAQPKKPTSTAIIPIHKSGTNPDDADDDAEDSDADSFNIFGPNQSGQSRGLI